METSLLAARTLAADLQFLSASVVSLLSRPPAFILLRPFISPLVFNSASCQSPSHYLPISWRPTYAAISRVVTIALWMLRTHTHAHFNFVGYTAYTVGVSGLSVALADVASLDYSLLMSVFYWRQHHSENRQEVELRKPTRQGLQSLWTKVIFTENREQLPPGSNSAAMVEKNQTFRKI